MGKGNVFFLKMKSVPRTLKLTMKGKKLDQHVLENQKRNSNNRGKWMDSRARTPTSSIDPTIAWFRLLAM